MQIEHTEFRYRMNATIDSAHLLLPPHRSVLDVSPPLWQQRVPALHCSAATSAYAGYLWT